jgi:hypothetical protein
MADFIYQAPPTKSNPEILGPKFRKGQRVYWYARYTWDNERREGTVVRMGLRTFPSGRVKMRVVYILRPGHGIDNADAVDVHKIEG